MTVRETRSIIGDMEGSNCNNCKYFNKRCQNFHLTSVAKTKRAKGAPCEYWEEKMVQAKKGEKNLKAKLLDLAIELEKIAYSLSDKEK